MAYTEIELEKYDSVRKYLGNLAESTQRINLHTIKYFMNYVAENSTKFSEYTPDDLVNYQLDAPTNREQYEILDELVIPWIRDTEGRVGYKQRHYATIRGFFKRNRAPLPSDPDFQIKNYTAEKVIGDLSIEEAKDIIQNSALQFKASFLVILQSGMDSQSFEYWNLNGWDSLQEQLRHNGDVIKIDLPARRKARNYTPYYTYIGGDAIDALRDYLKVRPETEHRAIILNDYGNPMNRSNVQTYWRRLLKRRGFVDPPDDPSNPGNRYAKSLHELRDVFRTQWQKAVPRPAPEVAEFMMGHGSGDANEYNKFYRDTDYTKQEYKKALPMLQIMSSGVPFGRVDRSEVEELRRQLEESKQGQNGRIAQLEAIVAQQQLTLEAIRFDNDREVIREALGRLPSETSSILYDQYLKEAGFTEKERKSIKKSKNLSDTS